MTRPWTSLAKSFSALLTSTALVAAGLGAVAVATAPAAHAVDRITQQSGFNARAWTVTTPDEEGTRYVGGDFTSYEAWNTGIGAGVDATTGAVDASLPKVAGWPYARAVIPDGSGGWYIGGGINNVDGTGVSRVAHINADGSLDTNFLPSVSGGQGVWAMAKVGDVLYIGGDFTSVQGQARTRLAALSTTDGTLLNWAPTASSTVWALAASGDTLFVGGQFSQISSTNRNFAASIRLDARSNASGTCVDNWDATDCLTTFNPNVAGGAVLDFAFEGSNVYLGGVISSVGGTARKGVARVDTTNGTLDTTFDAQLNGTWPDVESLEVAGGVLYIGGQFDQAQGATRNMLAAFSTSDGQLTSWNPNVTGNTVKSIDVEGSTIYVGGRFDFVDGVARNHAAAVDTSGNVTSWDPHVCDQDNGSESYVYGLAASGGEAYMIGTFPCVGGLKRMHAAAVSANGILTDWAPSVDGPVFAFSRTGSTVYMGGNFNSVNGVARGQTAAVDISGSLTSWAPTLDGRPVSIIATPNRIYLAGWFSTVNGGGPNNLAVLDPTTGAVDNTFDAQLNDSVRVMKKIGDDLYIGGNFTSVGGETHAHIAKIDANTGAVDSNFTASTGVGSRTWAYLEAIEVIGDRVFIGGYFGEVNGVTRSALAAVDAANGSLVTTWNPAPSNDVYALAKSPDGSVLYVGGDGGMTITSGSSSATGVAAVDPITGELTSWRADTGEVRGLSASDAALFLAGSFSSVGGESRMNTAAVGFEGDVLSPWPMDPSTSVPLVVSVTGQDGGLTSNPGGINCGGSCAYAYETGSSVTLSAVPNAGQAFIGWTGDCTGDSPTCTVSLSAARSVTAQFGAASGGGSQSPGTEPGTGTAESPTGSAADGSANQASTKTITASIVKAKKSKKPTRKIHVRGVVTGIPPGTELSPVLKIGKKKVKAGKKISVAADGTFTWKKKVPSGKKITVSFTDGAGVTSKVLKWRAIRK